MKQKRKVEVFTASCPLCDKAVKLVKELACASCEVIIYDLRQQGYDKARKYGVTSVPTVVVNGKIVDCCKRGGISKEALKNAGIGQPL